jgi:hypothetical protein
MQLQKSCGYNLFFMNYMFLVLAMHDYDVIIWEKYLVSSPIFHGRMKHVKIDYHFVRDRVLQKMLDV